MPPVEIRIDGAEARGNPSRSDLNANCGGDNTGCAVVGGIVEQTFEAHAIAQASARITIRWGARELAGIVVDFAALQ